MTRTQFRRRDSRRAAERLAGFVAVAVLAFGAAGCTSKPRVNEDFDDVSALAAMEGFVADSVAQLSDFPGFAARSVELRGCYYGVDVEKTLEGHDTVQLRYEFPESSWENPLVRETYPEELASFWEAEGHEVEVDRDDSGVITHVSATRDDGIALYYTVLGKVLIEVSLGGGSECVPVADGDFTIPEPVGGVLPDHDTFTDSGPRESE